MPHVFSQNQETQLQHFIHGTAIEACDDTWDTKEGGKQTIVVRIPCTHRVLVVLRASP